MQRFDRRLGATILAAALCLSLLGGLSITGYAADGNYDAGDVAVINAMIENNGLDWATATDAQTIPNDWSPGVTWSDGHIVGLSLNNKDMTGDLDLSGLTALKELWCTDNELTSLVISDNTELEIVGCYHNKLESLDVSGCTGLQEIWCSDNELTSLNVTGCTSLEVLDCAKNRLASKSAVTGFAGQWVGDFVFGAQRTGAETGYAATVYYSYAENTGSGYYEDGDTVSIDAGTRAGYSFSHWHIGNFSGDVNFGNVNSATTTFTMPAADVNVAANWIADGGQPDPVNVIDFTLTGDKYFTDIPGESGIWNPVTAKIEFPSQPETITVTIENTGTVALTDFEISLSDGAGHSADHLFTLGQLSATTLAVGDHATFTVRPNTGLASGDYEAYINVSNAVTATMIWVTYSTEPGNPNNPTAHTITASAGAGGSISPSGSVSVNNGAGRTFTITANSGYRISDVRVDGNSVGAQSSYTFTNVTANHTIAATFSAIYTAPDRDNDSDSDSGSGSGSSGGTSGSVSSSNTPSVVNATQATSSTRNAVTAAAAAGQDTATVRFTNPTDIALSTLQAMSSTAGNVGLTINADSMNGSAVDVRISLDPSQATRDLDLSASTTSVRAQDTTEHFSTYFSNNISTVSLGQQGAFGQPVQIAAKVKVTDVAGLVLYSYNRATNTYTMIENPGCWLDANGYLHFTTTFAGEIIISNGSLMAK